MFKLYKKYMYTIYKLYIVCQCHGCCKLVFFHRKKFRFITSLDRTLILHAHDPTSINLVTNHSHPALVRSRDSYRRQEISLPGGSIRTTSSRDRLQIPPTLTPFDLQDFAGHMLFCFQVAAEVRWVAGVFQTKLIYHFQIWVFGCLCVSLFVGWLGGSALKSLDSQTPGEQINFTPSQHDACD